jgi:hypothetical protein
MGGDYKWCLRSCSVWFASSVHLNLSWSLRNLKKGCPLSPSREMNRFNAAMRPVSFWTSLIILGVSMAVMALIFSGFASIPWWLTKNPSNFSCGTLKTHFVELSFHQNRRKLLNVSSSSVVNLLWDLVLMTTSST